MHSRARITSGIQSYLTETRQFAFHEFGLSENSLWAAVVHLESQESKDRGKQLEELAQV